MLPFIISSYLCFKKNVTQRQQTDKKCCEKLSLMRQQIKNFLKYIQIKDFDNKLSGTVFYIIGNKRNGKLMFGTCVINQ
jgi:hypothetical protein